MCGWHWLESSRKWCPIPTCVTLVRDTAFGVSQGHDDPDDDDEFMTPYHIPRQQQQEKVQAEEEGFPDRTNARRQPVGEQNAATHGAAFRRSHEGECQSCGRIHESCDGSE